MQIARQEIRDRVVVQIREGEVSVPLNPNIRQVNHLGVAAVAVDGLGEAA